jgi:ubiquinone/menaquinone biosynthesis C-methylase UbiE
VREQPRSIAFDRAASFYDDTRQLSVEAGRRVVELLTTELRGRGRCLEVGVGTGRIALPLLEAGIPLVGIDLSRPMLERLVEKGGGRPPFPVAIADAIRLPFRDEVFGVAYASHVLHLIPDWPEAVHELVRVVRSEGVVLIDLGGAPKEQSAIEKVSKQFEEEAGIKRRHRGVEDEDIPRLDQVFAECGARLRLLPEVAEERRLSIDGWIQLLRGNVFSWTWDLDDRTRNLAADRTLAWAKDQFGDLSAPQEAGHVIQWRAYDLPGSRS